MGRDSDPLGSSALVRIRVSRVEVNRVADVTTDAQAGKDFTARSTTVRAGERAKRTASSRGLRGVVRASRPGQASWVHTRSTSAWRKALSCRGDRWVPRAHQLRVRSRTCATEHVVRQLANALDTPRSCPSRAWYRGRHARGARSMRSAAASGRKRWAGWTGSASPSFAAEPIRLPSRTAERRFTRCWWRHTSRTASGAGARTRSTAIIASAISARSLEGITDEPVHCATTAIDGTNSHRVNNIDIAVPVRDSC